MSSWNVVTNDIAGHRTFSRELGSEELAFYWDSVFSGTATTVQNFEVTVAASELLLLAEENVIRTWIRVKNSFPLVACRVVEGDTVRFCLEEKSLRTVQTHEVEFHDIKADGDVDIFVNRLLNGPPLDCTVSVSQLLILRRRERPENMTVLLAVAHCVTDGMGNATLVRSFCNELCRPSDGSHERSVTIEERLSTILSLESYRPKSNIPPARMRWRLATGKIIFQLRQQKLTGGHTLPNRLTPRSMFTPALSKELYLTFSEELTAFILATCREMKMPLGSVLHVISQLAHARLIHRLRLQHVQNSRLEFGITKEDWESRIRQPMHFAGPLNLRPFLEPSWYRNGGSSEVCLSIGFWYISIPSMPFCSRPVETWEKQFPSFDELMSRERFNHRVNFVQRKMTQVIKSPLFHEISAARVPFRVERIRKLAMSWRERQKNPSKEVPVDPLPPVVLANGGSSIGNRDLLLPSEYPALDSQTTSTSHVRKLRIGRHISHLRCRPAELYVGSQTRYNRLEYFVLYDGNVFDEKIVKMWMNEAKAATLHYLGPSKSKL